MEMKQSFLAADPVYREQMESYTRKDSFLALGYWALWMAAYYFMGRVMVQTGKYYGEAVNIALILLTVLLCLRKVSSAGIARRNLKPSLLLGLAIGTVFLLAVTVIPGIVSGARLLPARQVLYNVYYYVIIIALSEEIGFRGYIQPRLYPLFRNEWLTVAAGGILFALMHIPFQMAARGMTLAEYLPRFLGSAPLLLIWHLVYTWLHRRYNNVFGAALLHGLTDLADGIFG